VVLDTLGAVARGGAQTLTWLVIAAAAFFVPAGLVIAELGSAFPNQGGPYVWTRLAFGRYAGSLVALVDFVETPVWVGGSAAITAVAVADRLLVPLEGGWRVAAALAFVWATVALAAAPLRAGQTGPPGRRRRPGRSWSTRPATSRRRSSAPAPSPAPCTRSRCWPSCWSSRPTRSPG
jgi:amino acid transporter